MLKHTITKYLGYMSPYVQNAQHKHGKEKDKNEPKHITYKTKT